MVIFGIDCGFSGAISIYRPNLGLIEVHDMPVMKSAKGKTILNLRGVLDLLEPEDDTPHVAVIEQVAGNAWARRYIHVSLRPRLRPSRDGYRSTAPASSLRHAAEMEGSLWPVPRQRCVTVCRVAAVSQASQRSLRGSKMMAERKLV